MSVRLNRFPSLEFRLQYCPRGRAVRVREEGGLVSTVAGANHEISGNTSNSHRGTLHKAHYGIPEFRLVYRRRLLALAGAATLTLGGCLDTMSDDAVVTAEAKPASPDTIDVFYDELPPDEQAIVRTAVHEDFYHACPELPHAVQSFADRVGDGGDTYLEYQAQTYGLWVRITDLVYAATASPPEKDPHCGIF